MKYKNILIIMRL